MTEQFTLQLHDTQDKTEKANDLVVKAERLTIKTDQQAHQAADFAKTLKAFVTEVEEYFKDDIERANKLHKSLTKKRGDIVTPVKTAYRAIADKIAVYTEKRKREQEEKERAAALAAQKKEEEKKAKLEAQAQEAEAAGNDEKAEALRQKQEETYVAPRPVASAPKVTGFAQRWNVEVIVENKAKVPENYKVVDEQALKRVFQASKFTLDVPGVKFIKRPAGAVRGR